MRIYLSLDQKTGRFFEYSKEPKEGWEKNVYTSKDGSSTSTTYRNYYPAGVRGKFKGIKLQDGKFGKQFQVGLEEDGVTRILSFPYKSQKGYHDDNFLVPLLKVFPNMETEEVYTIKAYRFLPADSIYERSGVKVEDSNGESLKWAISEAYMKKTGELVEGDIPPKKFNKTKNSKKAEMDLIAFAERTKYLDAVVDKLLENNPANFGSIQNNPNTTTADSGVKRDVETQVTDTSNQDEPVSETSQVEVKTEEVSIENTDDVKLPF